MSFLARFRKPAPPRAVWSELTLREALHREMTAAGAQLMTTGFLVVNDRVYAPLTHGEAFSSIRDTASFYAMEVNDCDDKALLAKAHIVQRQRRGDFGGYPAAFGILYTEDHALNLYLTEDGKVWLIDADGVAVSPKTYLRDKPVRLLLI